jgi:hypothetical protein
MTMNKIMIFLWLLAACMFSSMKSVPDEEIKESAHDKSDLKPLFLLNGKSIGYNVFPITSKGTLELIKDQSESASGTRIPFRVYLMRENIMVNSRNLEFLSPVYAVEISKLLALAKQGDQLILAPVHKEEWAAKRILTVVTGIGC